MKKNNLGLSFLSFAALAIALSACTKETPFKTELKEETLSKSSVDLKAQYIYVGSYEAASRTSDDAIPFYQGDEELVKFEFSRKGLDVIAIDRDKRFENAVNNKLIMSIPVEHVEYRCAQDRFGECKNEEEQNKDLPELERNMFKPKLTEIVQALPSTLPADIDTYFGGCYEQKDAKLLSYEFTPNAINIRVAKTVTKAAHCLTQLRDFKDTVATIVYHHSFVKVDAAATPGYKPVLYPNKDEGTFGFFTTEQNLLDVDNREVERNKRVYMNRWNPEAKEVVYYLSDEFAKPENALLKKATYSAFDKMNTGLAESGAKFRLVLKDPAGKFPGDIRNSMIVLVEDPSAAGLLGYGPSVTNPHTGEILSARTVMYSGIMKTGIRETYEEVRRKISTANAEKARSSAPVSRTGLLNSSLRIDENSFSFMSPNHRWVSPTRKELAEKRKLKKESTSKVSGVTSGGSVGSSKTPFMKISNLSNESVKAIAKSLTNYKANVGEGIPFVKKANDDRTETQERIEDYQKRLDSMSKHCFYPMEFMNFEELLMAGIQKGLGEELKPFDELSDEEKTKLIDLILPAVYVPTLIHEVGHNLGLRHNFQGSEDKDNWYKPGEIAGLNREIPLSSVMDYNHSDLNGLPALGKYDVAALRFAYTRQVKDEAGKLVSVPTTLEDLQKANPDLKLHEYGFCTDEHVGANAGCKRFDEGTNFLEITQFWIKNYYDTFSRSNFRNGREDFSLTKDLPYISRRYAMMNNLRLMYETYERVREGNRLSDNDEVWTKEPSLKALRDAAMLSAKFFIDIIRTPDVTCIVQDNTGATPTLALQPLNDVSPALLSCYDPDLRFNDGFEVIGEAGRSFQSKKDRNSQNPYVDQIDVRGIWGDKLAALETLLARELGSPSFDKYITTYIDVPELRQQISTALEQVLFDDLRGPVRVRLKDGGEVETQIGYSLAKTHVINEPVSRSVNRFLGMPFGEVPFIDQVSRIMNRSIPSRVHNESSRLFLLPFTVYTQTSLWGMPSNLVERGGNSVEINSVTYAALPENRVALRAIDLYKAAQAFAKIQAADDDKGTLQTKLQELVSTGKTEVPADFVAAEDVKAAMNEALKMKKEIIQAAFERRIRPASYYAQLLSVLPEKVVNR